MPTNAEWEYTCRAGTETRYFGGDDFESLRRTANVADVQYYEALTGLEIPPEAIKQGSVAGVMAAHKDGFAYTSPVGEFAANAFGLHDVHGNASTWCLDRYGDDYYSKSPSENPLGPEQGERRVVRGGGFPTYPAYCRSAARFGYLPSVRLMFIGFRVVREISKSD